MLRRGLLVGAGGVFALNEDCRGLLKSVIPNSRILCDPLNTAAESAKVASESVDRLNRMIRELQSRVNVNRHIDHTALKADLTREDIHKLCDEAIQHNFKSVCVNGSYVRLASQRLSNSSVKHQVDVCAVVGFPLGASTTSTKAYEAEEAIKDGAGEIDMVINVGRAKAREWDYVLRDISAVVSVCKKYDAVCKVILETSLLDDDEKEVVSTLCVLAGADFVKTSTGFSTGGATIQDVKLMRSSVTASVSKFPFLFDIVGNKQVGIKASGGISTLSQAHAMVHAGASRLGTSKSVDICTNGGTASAGY